MNPGSSAAIAPGAASQLGALLAAVAGAALVAVVLQGVLWLRHRGRAGPSSAADAPGSRPGPDAASLRRLLGAVLLGALLLPTAAAIRQLWPHPELGPRLLVAWLPLVAIPAVVWLLARGGDPPGRPRP